MNPFRKAQVATVGIALISVALATACAGDSRAETAASDKGWGEYVVQCLDTLIEHGRDTYGELETPLWMAVLDVRTLESPEHPELHDSLVRLEDRLHRRGERGSNLWYDQSTLRCLYEVGRRTGDPKYAEAADAYVAYAFEHCRKANGLLVWGSHIYWDCYRERAAGDDDGSGPHEILVYRPAWAEMYRVDPEGVTDEIERIWEWHVVDKDTGMHNRHDDKRRGCDFAFSGATFAGAFAFLYHATDDPIWLERAKKIANWHWRHRDPTTGLIPDAPCTGDRYDAHHCFTNEPGLFAAQLLRCYALTGDEEFRDQAVALIKAYDAYGWDEEHGTYHAMLKLDGTPVLEQAKGEGYDAWAPYGPVNVWRTSIFSYEFTLAAAQAAVLAYEVTGDPELSRITRRWARVIEDALPPRTGRRWKAELEAAMPAVLETGGAYAEDYGRAISFFVHVYRATGEDRFMRRARELAEEAVEKLFENGLFKGHPAKPYYEVVDGVGLLLYALLELDDPARELEGAF